MLFDYAVKTYGEKPYLGSRPKLSNGKSGPYHWLTYNQIDKKVKTLLKGFRKELPFLEAQDKIGFYSSNRVEWKVSEIVCWFSNLVVVSLYDSLGPDAIQFILKHAECRAVFVSGVLVPRLLDALRLIPKNENKIRTLIVFDKLDSKYETALKSENIQLFYFEDLEKIGKELENEEAPIRRPKPTDLTSIMYTSGTTGERKSVERECVCVCVLFSSFISF